jgi:hypothetical protein
VCGGIRRACRPPARSPCSFSSLPPTAAVGAFPHPRVREFFLVLSAPSSLIISFLVPLDIPLKPFPMPLDLVASAPCCPSSRSRVLSRLCVGWGRRGVRGESRHGGGGRTGVRVLDGSTSSVSSSGTGASMGAGMGSGGGSSGRSGSGSRARGRGQREC